MELLPAFCHPHSRYHCLNGSSPRFFAFKIPLKVSETSGYDPTNLWVRDRYVGVDVPLRRLLLFALVFSATHNGLQMLSDQPEHGDCAYSAHSKRAYPAATGASPSAGRKHRRRPPRRADRSQCRGGCPTAYLLRGTA